MRGVTHTMHVTREGSSEVAVPDDGLPGSCRDAGRGEGRIAGRVPEQLRRVVCGRAKPNVIRRPAVQAPPELTRFVSLMSPLAGGRASLKPR
jgi:hypothetical protein